MSRIFQTLLDNPCTGLVTGAVFFVVGKLAIGGEHEKCHRLGWGIGGMAAIVMLLFSLHAGAIGPVDLGVQCLITTMVGVGTAWIFLAIGHLAILEPIHRARLRRAQRSREQQWQKEHQEQQETHDRLQELAKKIELERVKHLPKPSPPAAPPITQELLARAKARYDHTLRLLEAAGLDELELNAARARAKQQYLRDIDQVMQ